MHFYSSNQAWNSSLASCTTQRALCTCLLHGRNFRSAGLTLADLMDSAVEHEEESGEPSVAPPAPDASGLQPPGLRALYQRYFTTLVAGLRSTYGAGPPDPDDVAHAAFEKLSRRGRLNEIADLEGYVWIAARNIIMSAKRAERVRFNNQDELERRWPGQPGDSFDPERVLIAEQQLDEVFRTSLGLGINHKH